MDPLAPRVLARFLERIGYGTPGGWEHRKEKDEAVIVNLPPHLQALWRKVKHQFKGSPERRLEQFMEYVEQNEGEGMAALVEDTDAKLDKMIREYERRPHEQEVPFAG